MACNSDIFTLLYFAILYSITLKTNPFNIPKNQYSATVFLTKHFSMVEVILFIRRGSTTSLETKTENTPLTDDHSAPIL
jgi:hypothetical protein